MAATPEEKFTIINSKGSTSASELMKIVEPMVRNAVLVSVKILMKMPTMAKGTRKAKALEDVGRSDTAIGKSVMSESMNENVRMFSK